MFFQTGGIKRVSMQEKYKIQITQMGEGRDVSTWD